MSKKIAFLLDTGSSYQPYPSDCYVLPMIINVIDKQKNDKTYLDNETLKREELNCFLDENLKISTSQPIIGMIIEKLEELYKEYDLVIAVPFSKYLSSAFNTVLSLKQEFGEDKLLVANINAMSISGNWFVEYVKEYLKNHNDEITQEQLDKLAEEVRQKTCGAVIVTDTQQLINGGRLKGVKGIIAKTLKLKLVIKYQGNLEFAAKDKSLEGAIDKTLDLIDKEINFRKNGIKHVSIFADLRDEKSNQKFYDYAKKQIGENLEYSTALLPGCVIAHTGRDTFSILIEAK